MNSIAVLILALGAGAPFASQDPAPPPGIGSVSLTNSVAGHGGIAIKTAVDKGDVQAVVSAGGTPEQAMAALKVAGRSLSPTRAGVIDRLADISDGARLELNATRDGEVLIRRIGVGGSTIEVDALGRAQSAISTSFAGSDEINRLVSTVPSTPVIPRR